LVSFSDTHKMQYTCTATTIAGEGDNNESTVYYSWLCEPIVPKSTLSCFFGGQTHKFLRPFATYHFYTPGA